GVGPVVVAHRTAVVVVVDAVIVDPIVIVVVRTRIRTVVVLATGPVVPELGIVPRARSREPDDSEPDRDDTAVGPHDVDPTREARSNPNHRRRRRWPGPQGTRPSPHDPTLRAAARAEVREVGVEERVPLHRRIED